MSIALTAVQRRNAELWATFEKMDRDSSTHHYVDVYNPSNLSETYKTAQELTEGIVKAADAQKGTKEEEAMEKSWMNVPATEPQYMAPISLELVDGGDSNTYFSEFENMLNVPFAEGQPLMSVRLVRHSGGTDILMSGHQAIFDDPSFDTICCHVLEAYIIAAEGRLKQLDSSAEVSPVLLNIDAMYPEEFKTYSEGLISGISAAKRLDNLQKQQNWMRLPYSTDLPPNTNPQSDYYASLPPPSPALNVSASIFGTLSFEASTKLAGLCQKKKISLSALFSSCVLRQTARVINPEAYRHLKSLSNANKETKLKKKSKVRKEAKTTDLEGENKKKIKKIKVKSKKTQIKPEPKTAQEILATSKNDSLATRIAKAMLRTIPEELTEAAMHTRLPDPKSETRFIAGQIMNLRPFFDPSISGAILGQLSSYTLLPSIVDARDKLWATASSIQEMNLDASISLKLFVDNSLMPNLTAIASSEQSWDTPIVPTIWVAEPSPSFVSEQMRTRFKIYDFKAAMSCWNPGVIVSSQVDNDMLHVTVSYRRPLIDDSTAHSILQKILKELSSL